MKLPKLRKNPDGRAFIQIPNSKGRRKYLGPYGSEISKAKYKAWCQQFIASGGVEPSTGDGDALIVKAVNQYLEHIKNEQTPGSYRQVKKACESFFQFMGNARGSDITSMNFRAFQQHLSAKTYTKGGKTQQVTRVRAQNLTSKVRLFIKWASSHGLFPIDTWHRVQVVESLKEGYGRESSSREPISWEILIETLPFLPRIIQTMCQVQFLCGMRPGEVCGLKRDFDRTGVYVGKKRIWLYEFEKHKTSHRGHDLIKAIPPKAQTLLEQWESRGDCGMYFFSPRQAIRDNYGWDGPWVEGRWPDQDRILRSAGEKYKTNAFADLLASGVDRARAAKPHIPKWTANQLRHGMATHIRRTQGIEEAGIYAGHKNVDTTLIYASKVTQQLVVIAAAFDESLGNEAD